MSRILQDTKCAVMAISNDCICTILPLYSTTEFDVIIGTINMITGCPTKNPDLHINDEVYVFLDSSNPECSDAPLSKLCVREDHVFKVIDKEDMVPLRLPILKYGSLACYLKKLIPPMQKVDVFSDFNVFDIIGKILSRPLYKLSWHSIDEFLNLEKNEFDKGTTTIAITPLELVVIHDNHWHKIDYDIHSLIDEFGYENIETMLNLSIREHLLANVYYVPLYRISEETNHSNIKSRFFTIVTFS